MKSRFRVPVWMVLLSVISLAAFTPQEATQDARGQAAEMESLIRMDLLRGEKKTLPPPRRNIFTAGKKKNEFQESDDEFFGESGTMEEGKSPPQIEQAFSALDLRYIGYVRSGERMVALVIYQGEALAVAEGEEIESGVTIGKILPGEIEITGPDSEPSKFFLEGELP
ncbi:MAG: hypothetical protein JXB23_17790 [Candidatus Aminicenantes bacterium]|nr:hypothetical protein [Candidatus Aminicenantes bacterium]